MQKRIKQVIAALTAKVELKDKVLINQWLTVPQKRLFWAMNLPDQYHAIQVAYTALRLAKQRNCSVDQRRLLQCCLLHDVGKVRGDVSTFDKIFTVIANHCTPQRARRWSKAGRGGRVQNIRHALYIYFYHAQLGQQQLSVLGFSEIAAIIARHHDPRQIDDSQELLLLREADELN